MTVVRAQQRINVTDPENENEIPDSQNPRYLFCGISTVILSAIVKGEIDPSQLAKEELRNRGLNDDGLWIGFPKKKQYLEPSLR